MGSKKPDLAQENKLLRIALEEIIAHPDSFYDDNGDLLEGEIDPGGIIEEMQSIARCALYPDAEE